MKSKPKTFTFPIGDRIKVRVYEDSSPQCLEISPLQKGLILVYDNLELIEEGAGFGTPVVKYSNKTYFSSSAKIMIQEKGKKCVILKTFALDTITRKRIGKNPHIDNKTYRIFNKLFNEFYLNYRTLYLFFNFLMEFRQTFGFQTDFIKVKSKGKIEIKYELDEKKINVVADFRGLEKADCKEILILNEQGASFFTIYSDGNGQTLSKEQIGAWKKVNAERASLSDDNQMLKFTLHDLKSVALFRGREKTKKRFSWSGLSYSISPNYIDFHYSIELSEKN